MERLLIDNLYEEVILSSVNSGFNNIAVISGFVSPPFARQVLSLECNLKVIIGMVGYSGLPSIDHKGFRELESETAPGRFQCHYYAGSQACHLKAFSFRNNANEVRGFAGSANFTWKGFNENIEALVKVDGDRVSELYSDLLRDCIPCVSTEADKYILSVERSEIRYASGLHVFKDLEIAEEVEISLLDARGEMHGPGGGLNWGQPKPGRARRNPNEAYIPIPRRIHQDHPGFFPPRSSWFLVQTDDGELMWFTATSGSDEFTKDLQTPESNAKLGVYLRRRLGIPNGQEFKKDDLLRYGRTTVTFRKIGEGLYYFNFSK